MISSASRMTGREHWVLIDSAALMEQLGVAPAGS